MRNIRCIIIMRKVRFFILFIFWNLALGQSGAQTATENNAKEPNVMVLPWETVGIDPAITTRSRKLLQAGYKALVNLVLNTPETLDIYLKNKGLQQTSNSAIKSRKIFIGEAKDNTFSSPTTIQPLLCNLGPHYFIGIELSDTDRNITLGTGNVTITRAQWFESIGQAQIPELITQAIEGSLTSAVDNQKRRQSTADALHLNFSLLREYQSTKVGSSLCLNWLLAGQMALQYKVNRLIGNDHYRHGQKALSKIPPQQTEVVQYPDFV